MSVLNALILVSAMLITQTYNYQTDETVCVYRTSNNYYTQVFMGDYTCPGTMQVEE